MTFLHSVFALAVSKGWASGESGRRRRAAASAVARATPIPICSS